MRRGFWVGALLVLIVVAIGVGVGAYNVGFDAGLEEAETAGGEVVRVVGDRWGRGGGLFFPFGFLLFPLFFIGISPLSAELARRSRRVETGSTTYSHQYARPSPSRASNDGPLSSSEA